MSSYSSSRVVPGRSYRNRKKNEKGIPYAMPYYLRSNKRIKCPLGTGPWLMRSCWRWTLPVWCHPRLLFSEQSRVALRLQRTLDRKSGLLEKSRRLLSNSLKESLRLEKELQVARTGTAAATPKRNAKRRTSKRAKKKFVTLSPEQRKQIEKLENKSAKLNLKIKAIQDNQVDLEYQVTTAFTANNLFTAQSKTKTVLLATGKLFSKDIPRWTRRNARLEARIKSDESDAAAKFTMNCSPGALFKARNTLDKVELIVQAKEAAAAEAHEKMLSAQKSAPDMEREPKQEGGVIAQIVKARHLASSWFDSLGALIRNADPSIERAYQRLEKQLASARNLAEHSEQAEGTLEEQIEKHRITADTFQQQADVASQQSEEHLTDVSPSRRETLHYAVDELSNVLSIIKRRNLSIAQTLFRVEGIARRLFSIKLLLSALPVSTKNEAHEFTQFVDAVVSYLKTAIRSNGEVIESPDSSANISFDFASRIWELEQKTLMCYIRFMKSDLKHLKAKRLVRFTKDVSTISATLNSERYEAKLELERWSDLKEQALRKRMELLHAVSVQRMEHYSSLIKMTEQTLDVLSTTSLEPAKAGI